MSDWSRMSSTRFGKEEESLIGPGSYELPTTMDERGVLIVAGERWQDEKCDESGVPFMIYEDSTDKSKLQASSKPRRALSAKENRQPASQNVMDNYKGEKGYQQESLELEQLRRRLADEEKRRAAAEARASDLAIAKKSAGIAHAQLQSQEKKNELLQKELEEVEAAKRDALRRACDLECEKGRGKKALVEKEQQAAALQKSLNLAKAQLEERAKKLEELSSATAYAEQMRHEAERLRQRLEDLQQRSAGSPSKVGGSPCKVPPLPSPSPQRGLRSLEFAEGILNSLEQRFAEQSAETAVQLQGLVEAQERLHGKVLEDAVDSSRELSEVRERLHMQARELERRRSQLLFVLEQSKQQEAQLEAMFLVREASLSALASLAGERDEATLQDALAAKEQLQGELEAHRGEVALLTSKCKELHKALEGVKLQSTQDAERLGCEAAEVRGRLFTSEQAQILSQKAREDLQRQLDSAVEQAKAREAELEAEAERLQAELYEALAAAAEAEEAFKRKSVEAADFDQEKDELHRRIKVLEEQKLEAAQAVASKDADLEQQARQVAEFKNMAEEAKSEGLRTRRKTEDLEASQQDFEDQRRQNRELLDTMKAYQQDLQRLEAENLALREAEAVREASIDKEMERQALSAGHINHRQKIQHIIDLKKHNDSLRDDLAKAKRKMAQMQIASRGEYMSTVLAPSGRLSSSSGGVDSARGARDITPMATRRDITPTSARRPALVASFVNGAVRDRRSSWGGPGNSLPIESSSSQPFAEVLSVEEAMRRCSIKERALERVSADYQHLMSLIDRVALSEGDAASGAASNEGASAMLGRLRELALADRERAAALKAASALKGPQAEEAATTPNLEML
mmetsp:Transcript_5789/g.10857  ORF Transcript_5789/g.10857 Transcript_5789/m.10857 type:complete len:862 (-) Transcript_5789:249-2834(-)